MKHLTSQILERNAEHFGTSLLIINPPESDTPSIFNGAHIICFDYRSYGSLNNQFGGAVQFGLDDISKAKFKQVLLYMPKSKAELAFQLDIASTAIEQGGEILLVGEKKSGINSGSKLLNQMTSNASKLDSAKHCQLWSGEASSVTEKFDLAHHFSITDYDVDGTHLKIASLPGVFSVGRLDEGTSFLLQQNLRRLKGRTLDFGCGAGVISCFLKTKFPELNVEAIDSSWLALESTRRSLELNELEASVYASDGWSAVEGRVNGVVTNPPFHQGVSTEYETTEGFIRQAHGKMARYAPMYMVANNFLKYPALIEKVFGQCQYTAKNNKFNVYYCER